MPTATDRIYGLNTALAFKAPCRVGTTAAITLSGTQTIDGVAVVAGDRVLVMDQAALTANGIYVVAADTWTRAADFAGTRDAIQGTMVYVTSGTVNGDKLFKLDTTGVIEFDTSNIEFSPFETESSVLHHEVLTGVDGVATDFTLDYAPGSIYNILGVVANGVMLTPATDYSLSGSTLTFTTAPPSGWEILVRYVRGLLLVSPYALAGPLEDSLITGAAESGANTSITGLDRVTMTDALNEAPFVTVASSASIDLGAAASNNVNISGVASISSLGTAASGITRKGRATGAFTWVHNASSLIVQGSANYTMAVGDRWQAVSVGSGNWYVNIFPLSGAPVSASATGADGAYRSMQVFTASGTYTKPSGLSRAEVLVVAAGGAGATGAAGNGGGGGGGGGASRRLLATASIAATETVTVGVGDSGAGDSSSFGTLATATGGAAGSGLTGGAGGAGASGTINMSGQRGGDGTILGNGGHGGDPAGGMGHGGRGAPNDGGGAGDAGTAGVTYGGGGGGGGYDTTGGAGGNGASGIVIVWEYF